MQVAERLFALRKRTGLSRQAFARLLGYRSAAGYYRYEDVHQNSHAHLPAHMMDRLRRLIGMGSPPITMEEIAELAPPALQPPQEGREKVDAAFARLGNALAAGRMGEAAAHCQVLAGEIALLRLSEAE